MQQLAGNVQGAVVRNGSGGKLVLVDLPETAAGSTYEAWLIGADKKPVARRHVRGRQGRRRPARRAMPRGSKTVAITVEPAGGSQAPTTKPVAAAQLA